MEFHGRKRELELLQSAWHSERPAFIPVYGRRRVGKSELILRFMNGRQGLYFVGKRAPGAAQIQEFLEAAARAVREPLLARSRINSWKAAFEAVTERWKESGKLILALDEFQWMAEASPELPSVLQELWDHSWSRSGRVMLLLCGSYLGFMEREVLGARSPLFGRRTGQILLRPFDHLEAASFHPGYSIIDQARVYGICGGIPAYLLAFDGRCSVEQNIMRGLLDDSAPLAREPEFLLREELRDLIPYHALLTTLAQGQTTPSLLAKTTGMETRGLNYYLNTLVELGYVQRRLPVMEGRPTLRQVRYGLEDPLLRFWFRFVFPHQSLLRSLGPERGFAELVQPELSSYQGHCFERLCRESLPRIYAQEGVRASFTVGEYWDKEVQIDLVGLREDNWTDLGECKWGDAGSLTSLAGQLESKVRLFPNPRNATIGRRLFLKEAKAGAKAPASALRLHTLKDLYHLR